MTAARPLRVCYFGTYRADYNRNRILREALRQNGVIVYECHVRLWRDIEDRVQVVSGGWRRPTFWWRVWRAYATLLWRYWQIPDHDIVIVGYPGQLDVFPARLVSWLRRKPLVWDILMSLYLVASERGLERYSRLGVELLRPLEWAACRLPDLLILDTPDYVGWFHRAYGIDPSRFRLVPIGADDHIFQPPSTSSSVPRHQFCVVYYGTFITNHGVRYIVEAARLLQHEEDIHFELIGEGPERPLVEELARRYGLANITFINWLEPRALVRRLADAAVCLGVFGATTQSLLTIHNKIYEGLAMRRAVISGDSPAMRRVFIPGHHLYLVPRADAAELAQAIRTLKADSALSATLANAGYSLYRQRFTPGHLGRLYRRYLLALLRGKSSSPRK